MKKVFSLVSLILFTCIALPAKATQCSSDGLHLQVLGSGNSSLNSGRAAPGYLVWHRGHARALIDAGGGTAMQFLKTGARFADLNVILFTQVDSAHTAAMPAMMSSAIFENRTRPLPVFGPAASKNTPSTVSFIRSLFDEKRGAYRDLGTLLSPLGTKTFKLKPHNVKVERIKPDANESLDSNPVFRNANFKVYRFAVSENKVSKLGWVIEFGSKKIIFTGDADPAIKNLHDLTKSADLLVMHHAIPESGAGSDTSKYLSPSAIGTVAYKSRAKQLVLGHRSTTTLGKEKETIAAIKSKYAGLVHFANDLDCFTP